MNFCYKKRIDAILLYFVPVNHQKLARFGNGEQPQKGCRKEKLFSVEEKWIKNEINKDTYHRWYSIYNSEILNLKRAIERLSNDKSEAFSVLEDNLNLLTDMCHVYTVSDTLQKREFMKMVFDSNLRRVCFSLSGEAVQAK